MQAYIRTFYFGCATMMQLPTSPTSLSSRCRKFLCLHAFATQTLCTSRDAILQMEVGIEDCLHIEFEYDKSRYNLKDTVVGKIYFLLVWPPSRWSDADHDCFNINSCGNLFRCA